MIEYLLHISQNKLMCSLGAFCTAHIAKIIYNVVVLGCFYKFQTFSG